MSHQFPKFSHSCTTPYLSTSDTWCCQIHYRCTYCWCATWLLQQSAVWCVAVLRLHSSCPQLAHSCVNSSVTSFQCHRASVAAVLAADSPVCWLQALCRHVENCPHWCTELPDVWNTPPSNIKGVSLWQYDHPASALCLFGLLPTVLCGLGFGCLEQHPTAVRLWSFCRLRHF